MLEVQKPPRKKFIVLFTDKVHLQAMPGSLHSALKGPIQNMPEEFENGGFTLKTHQMFSIHTTTEA